jgi:hypothetical protein
MLGSNRARTLTGGIHEGENGSSGFSPSRPPATMFLAGRRRPCCRLPCDHRRRIRNGREEQGRRRFARRLARRELRGTCVLKAPLFSSFSSHLACIPITQQLEPPHRQCRPAREPEVSPRKPCPNLILEFRCPTRCLPSIFKQIREMGGSAQADPCWESGWRGIFSS